MALGANGLFKQQASTRWKPVWPEHRAAGRKQSALDQFGARRQGVGKRPAWTSDRHPATLGALSQPAAGLLLISLPTGCCMHSASHHRDRDEREGGWAVTALP